jgi:hypothetical protein
MKLRTAFRHTVLAMAGLVASCALLPAATLVAQDIQPNFPVTLDKKLAARATNVDEVTMDKKMLGFAGQFMNDKKESDQQAKALIQNLDGIYVRDYEFAQPGQYTQEDLNLIRRQFLGPEWNPMVRERSLKTGESTDVYVKMIHGEVHGMFVLDAEPKELNFVYISGRMKPSDLQSLSGNFGVPNLGGHGAAQSGHAVSK